MTCGGRRTLCVRWQRTRLVRAGRRKISYGASRYGMSPGPECLIDFSPITNMLTTRRRASQGHRYPATARTFAAAVDIKLHEDPLELHRILALTVPVVLSVNLLLSGNARHAQHDTSVKPSSRVLWVTTAGCTIQTDFVPEKTRRSQYKLVDRLPIEGAELNSFI